MSRDKSDRINDLFAAGSRDLTPASAGHAAYVLYAPVSRDPEVSRHCASVLSDTELQRADRFAAEYDRALFTQRRAFRRFCGATVLGSSRSLSQIVFEETENGRPYLSDLPDIWFSFSSCRFGFLGAWSSTHGIGVDLEDQTKNLEAVELAHRFFSGAEANAVKGVGGLERLRTFFQFWSLKEAALKSIGEGLPFGLDAFQFELDPNLRVVHTPSDHGGPGKFNAHMIGGTDSCAALVIRDLT
ncbi:MAG: 4'-phosphopantetheinyl transferase superfamily protein [Thermodesulfobacteriota bacterium]|nr:4'-phosphopantetheinyl transferase superfamily protein [Thermodesulfobacteriota bacterium]